MHKSGLPRMSFGTCGTVLTDVSDTGPTTDIDGARKAVVQSDSKLIASGNTNRLGPEMQFAAIRYNADGTLDGSFGDAGIVITPFEGHRLVTVDAACLQQVQTEFGVEERLVQAGFITNSSGQYGTAVVRYTPSGELDASFNGSGKKAIFLDSPYFVARACANQSDGKIVLAGAGGRGWNFVRLNFDGSLDTSFGTGGRVYIPFANIADSFPWDVVIQQTPAGERILGGGQAYASGKSGYDFGLIRLDLSGALDSTFGTSGKVVTDFYKQGDQIFRIAIDPTTGDILAAGSAYRSSKSQSRDFALARYTPNGTLSFKVATDFLGKSDYAKGIAIQSDGMIVVGGSANNSSGYSDFAVARYTPSGALDLTFGSGGKAVKDFAGYSDYVNSVVLQQVNGYENIIVGGVVEVQDTSSPYYGYNFALARYFE